MNNIGEKEFLHQSRFYLQKQLDAEKNRFERNRLGQFATPATLATDMVESLQICLPPNSKIRFFDPAFGTGVFYSALRDCYGDLRIEYAGGVEIDTHYGIPAQKHWQSTILELIIGDFTDLEAPNEDSEKPNLIICNPPYSRHHHLPPRQKQILIKKVKSSIGIKVSGLSGLYCYFLLLAHDWLASNGVGCWLIPGEFLDVNYGQSIKTYLLDYVQLLRIHRFNPDDIQFEDALVSSVVIWFCRQPPKSDKEIEFTSGGELKNPLKSERILPKQLKGKDKWSSIFSGIRDDKYPLGLKYSGVKLSELFHIKRGVATGANKFFIFTHEKIQRLNIPRNLFVPILPSPRDLDQYEIIADDEGVPLLDKPLFLLNCRLPESQVQEQYPTLWSYLEKGIKKEINQRYLCRHRTPWYSQEYRPPAPILCTYMGRNKKPFNFILNHSQAIASNVYLMLYPKKSYSSLLISNPELLKKIWHFLNNLKPDELKSKGRVYGGGLFKIEPRELGNVLLTGVESILPDIKPENPIQLTLL